METVLALLKLDLGITHSLRDELFAALLASAQSDLTRRGVMLNLAAVEDQMLLSDYAAWRYRSRTEDVPLAKNLAYRIRARIVEGRARHGT